MTIAWNIHHHRIARDDERPLRDDLAAALARATRVPHDLTDGSNKGRRYRCAPAGVADPAGGGTMAGADGCTLEGGCP